MVISIPVSWASIVSLFIAIGGVFEKATETTIKNKTVTAKSRTKFFIVEAIDTRIRFRVFVFNISERSKVTNKLITIENTMPRIVKRVCNIFAFPLTPIVDNPTLMISANSILIMSFIMTACFLIPANIVPSIALIAVHSAYHFL